MTRKEEIKCASKDYINYLLDKQEYHNENYTEYDIQQAFEKGAQWSDKNPKSPWISVKDDLPYKHEELILNKEHPFLTNKVLIKTEVRVHIAFMIKDIINDKWIWYGYGKDEDQITHWMPIPEQPKE